ncbi:MAG TPA: hypothetical protein VGI43_07435 [Mucilaginibacter sp.]|jgi:hypothetical protein
MENSVKEGKTKNTGKTIEKNKRSIVRNKRNANRVKIVATDSDRSTAGAPYDETSSNKGQGPAGENL